MSVIKVSAKVTKNQLSKQPMNIFRASTNEVSTKCTKHLHILIEQQQKKLKCSIINPTEKDNTAAPISIVQAFVQEI